MKTKQATKQSKVTQLSLTTTEQPQAIANLHHVYLVCGQSQFEVMPSKPVPNCYSIWRVLSVNDDGLWLDPLWANSMTASFVRFEKWQKAIKEDKGFYCSDKSLKLRRFLKVALLFKNFSMESTIDYIFGFEVDLGIPEEYNEYFDGKWKPSIKPDKPFMG